MREALVILALCGGAVWAQESPRVGGSVPLLAPEGVGKPSPAPDNQQVRLAPQKISFRVPLGWREVSTGRRQAGILASFMPLNATGATLSLAYSEDAGRTKLPENLPVSIATALAERYPGFRQTGKQHFTLSGADAWKLDGQVKPAGQSMVVSNRQVYICYQGRIYIATLTCKKEDFERLAPSLDRFLKSMTWLD